MTRRTVVLLAAAGATLAVLVLVVFPTRSYLKERGDMNSATHQLRTVDAQNRQLSDQIGRLNTDAEIERLARKDYGLVKPGEQAYAVLPGALAKSAAANEPPAAKPPAAKPPGGNSSVGPRTQAATGSAHPSFWDRFVDQLVFWR
jgi:cell division protein FtsB